MCDEIEKAPVSCPRPDRAENEGTEDEGEHNAEVGRQGKCECVVEAQALQRVATEEAVTELADSAGKAELIAGHGDRQPGADAGGDRTEPDALPAEHCRTRSSRRPRSLREPFRQGSKEHNRQNCEKPRCNEEAHPSLLPGLPLASPNARRRTSASSGDTDSAKRTRTALLFAVGSPRASIISSAR